MYKTEINYSFKELSPKEKIKMKTSNDFQSLDTLLDDAGQSIQLVVDNFVALNVHNDNSESKDYTKYIVIDDKGEKYSTGSESFFTTLSMIVDEMKAIDEGNFEIRVFKKPSKNYQGRGFITCELV